jgi:MFS family permease
VALARGAGARAIPRGVWLLGFTSLFMDVSSEMVHGLLPVFLTGVLGVSALSVGWIEGVSEATASGLKVFSGVASDRLRNRKGLATLGYGLSALTKPVFALAGSAGQVFAARFVDRVGKGIRGAPRDALVADLVGTELRGAAYGLRQSLDTVGAVLGPLLAAALMLATGGAFRTVFWIAALPALAAVAILAFGVREPPRAADTGEARAPLRAADLGRLRGRYWRIVLASVALTLPRASEAFLILRAETVGIPVAYLPLVLGAMNVSYAASAYPAGRLADLVDRRALLAVGCALLAASHAVLAAGAGPLAILAGVLLWGLHLGATQGLFAALVADATPLPLRATGFGVFHLATGLATLAASVGAGWLWQARGPAAPFAVGCALTLFALVSLLGLVRWRAPSGGAPA